jgi:hypothetical protein
MTVVSKRQRLSSVKQRNSLKNGALGKLVYRPLFKVCYKATESLLKLVFYPTNNFAICDMKYNCDSCPLG